MPIYIQNTLSGKKEELKPVEKGRISMYVCGPTVYDDPHIGHLRSAFVFDVIRKMLERSHKVNFVRNVTDVDDKIIDRSRREKVAIQEITSKYLKAYHRDLERLDIQKPTHEPRATEADNIHDMVSIIVGLIQKGLAYEADGNVYFKTRQFKSYGALSHQNIDQMLEHWRTEPGEGKQESLDFALWKKSREDEPSWGSPWGQGRPGWHIECSAMSARYCGQEFDIHGGGKDLLFPHHENERAQSVGCFEKPFARVWIHHGLVTTESRKMSKSLGNYITLDQVLERYPADVLKLFFLQSHYSQDADFSWDKMAEVHEVVKSFYLFFEKISREKTKAVPVSKIPLMREADQALMAELEDNFNTPKAITQLFHVFHEANRWLTEGEIAKAAAGSLWIREKGKLLGLFLDWTPEARTEKWPVIKELIALRNQKRNEKKYNVSDVIRSEMIRLGLHVEDAQEEFEIMGSKNLESPEVQEQLKELLIKAKAMK